MSRSKYVSEASVCVCVCVCPHVPAVLVNDRMVEERDWSLILLDGHTKSKQLLRLWKLCTSIGMNLCVCLFICPLLYLQNMFKMNSNILSTLTTSILV